MHPPTLLLTLLTLTATHVAALPLNINLGAYSPAIVVGDGAISFEGAEGGVAEGAGAASIVNALQGAAVAGASSSSSVASVNNAAVAAGGGGSGNGVSPPAVQAAVAAAAVGVDRPSPILNDPTAALPTPGSAKILDPRM
ncbi:hypothetical protein C8A00DRAFT_36616 [Chaetomidium leptoderma]|uniref:Uncharacterized protein n=1 Tax=Chaetomidium leptoderma TaxID=669021 RepID=A0AAN6ZUP9_9PEZI|nr:hypothetical protein C8A00DRAFT_36616 [Chaetomidium leptoderma]